MRIDLHTHSNVSDGTQRPEQLVQAAAEARLDVLALTDHDSTAGWQRALEAARDASIGFVPGMEISCKTADGVTVHLLSYLHDPNFAPLTSAIEQSRRARLQRAQEMVSLISRDYPITWGNVLDELSPGATVGRPHIADALVSAGVVAHRGEAFAGILSARSQYWVSHSAPEPAEAVALVVSAGGVPVFAHGQASLRGRVASDGDIRAMLDAGLAGVEVYHRDNTERGQAKLLRLAAENDLIVTGSSDYHGAGKPNVLGENTTTEENLLRILAAGTGSAAYLP